MALDVFLNVLTCQVYLLSAFPRFNGKIFAIVIARFCQVMYLQLFE